MNTSVIRTGNTNANLGVSKPLLSMNCNSKTWIEALYKVQTVERCKKHNMANESIFIGEEELSELRCPKCFLEEHIQFDSLYNFVDDEKRRADQLLAKFQEEAKQQLAFTEGKILQIDKAVKLCNLSYTEIRDKFKASLTSFYEKYKATFETRKKIVQQTIGSLKTKSKCYENTRKYVPAQLTKVMSRELSALREQRKKIEEEEVSVIMEFTKKFYFDCCDAFREFMTDGEGYQKEMELQRNVQILIEENQKLRKSKQFEELSDVLNGSHPSLKCIQVFQQSEIVEEIKFRGREKETQTQFIDHKLGEETDDSNSCKLDRKQNTGKAENHLPIMHGFIELMTSSYTSFGKYLENLFGQQKQQELEKEILQKTFYQVEKSINSLTSKTNIQDLSTVLVIQGLQNAFIKLLDSETQVKNKIDTLKQEISELKKQQQQFKQKINQQNAIICIKTSLIDEYQVKSDQEKKRLNQLLLAPPPEPSPVKRKQFFHSQILNEEQLEWLSTQLIDRVKFTSSRILYTASHCSFDIKNFHRLCDGKNNLVLVAKTSQGMTFGGYTQLAFGVEGANENENAFIYSVTRAKIMKKKEKSKATTNDARYGPIFGDGDITIEGSRVRSNYHIYCACYTRVEVEGVLAKEMLIGETETDLEDYEIIELIL